MNRTIRVKLLGRREEALTLQAPPGVRRASDHVFAVRHHPAKKVFGLRLADSDVMGVWERKTGKLLCTAPVQCSDLGWSADGKQVFVLACKFGPGPRGRGIGHRLLRYSWPKTKLIEELVFSVPSGGADYLVVSPSGRRAVVVAIEQTEWYNVLLDLAPRLRQRTRGHYVSGWLGDGPTFSPQENYLVSIAGEGWLWWSADPDDWEGAAKGGPARLATIHVHQLKSGRVTRHRLLIDLKPGWKPHDSERGDWGTVWGPEFVSERTFRLWLPDGQAAKLTLPLPRNIVLTKRLNPAGRPRCVD